MHGEDAVKVSARFYTSGDALTSHCELRSVTTTAGFLSAAVLEGLTNVAPFVTSSRTPVSVTHHPQSVAHAVAVTSPGATPAVVPLTTEMVSTAMTIATPTHTAMSTTLTTTTETTTSATTRAPPECVSIGTVFDPDMEGHPATIEADVVSCQDRCRTEPYCAHFAFSMESGTCTLQDVTSTEVLAEQFVSGPPNCVPGFVEPSEPDPMEEDDFPLWAWPVFIGLGLCCCGVIVVAILASCKRAGGAHAQRLRLAHRMRGSTWTPSFQMSQYDDLYDMSEYDRVPLPLQGSVPASTTSLTPLIFPA